MASNNLTPKPLVLTGLHHLTAVTGTAARNLEFYSQVLGLRLVKKTVNQDDLSAYHLFYGDKMGHPGTEVTFFDWPTSGAHRPGTSTISTTALRVAGLDILEWWEQRLTRNKVTHSGIEEKAGRSVLTFTDPEGQRLQLLDDGGLPGGTPWARSPVPAEMGIRGLGAVTLTVSRLRPTSRILTEALGFRVTGTYDQDGHPLTVFETGAGGPGTLVYVWERPDLPRGMVGRGGVHHVAFRTPNDDEQKLWWERLTDAGIPVSQVIDRYYFRSLYFQEPNGILFEIATDGPGFAGDEDSNHLGERLSLPPFLESRRAEIEAGLRPLPSTRTIEVSSQ